MATQKWPHFCREAPEEYLALQLLKKGVTGGANTEPMLETRNAAMQILDANETSDPGRMQLHNTGPHDKYTPSAWCPPGLEALLHETSTANALNGTNNSQRERSQR